MPAAVKFATKSGYVVCSVRACRHTEFALGKRLANAKCHFNPRKRARNIHKCAKVFISQPKGCLESIREGNDRNLSTKEYLHIGDRRRLCAQAFKTFVFKQFAVDIGTVNAACHKLCCANMRFGRYVGITKTARICTDGSVKINAHLLINGDALFACQMLDQIKNNFARSRRTGTDIALRTVGLVRLVMIDYQINAISKKRSKRSHLGKRRRINGDNTRRRKIGENCLGEHAPLHLVHQKLQVCGNLVLTNTTAI